MNSGDTPNPTVTNLNISRLSHTGEGRAGLAKGAPGFHSGLLSLHTASRKVNS